MEVREILETMLDILDEKDWIQGDLFAGPHGERGDNTSIPLDEVTGVCLAGAYTYGTMTGALVRGENDGWWLVTGAILLAARDLLGQEFSSVPQFNDFKDTTGETVRLALKKAIEKVTDEAPGEP